MTSKPTNTDSTKMENSPSVVSTTGQHLPVAGDAGPSEDLVAPVGRECAVVNRQGEQVRDVARVQRTRMQRVRRRRVTNAHDRDATDVDRLADPRQLAVAAALCAE